MFLYIVLIVALIFCLSFKTKKATHMLQQNLLLSTFINNKINNM